MKRILVLIIALSCILQTYAGNINYTTAQINSLLAHVAASSNTDINVVLEIAENAQTTNGLQQSEIDSLLSLTNTVNGATTTAITSGDAAVSSAYAEADTAVSNSLVQQISAAIDNDTNYTSKAAFDATNTLHAIAHSDLSDRISTNELDIANIEANSIDTNTWNTVSNLAATAVQNNNGTATNLTVVGTLTSTNIASIYQRQDTANTNNTTPAELASAIDAAVGDGSGVTDSDAWRTQLGITDWTYADLLMTGKVRQFLPSSLWISDTRNGGGAYVYTDHWSFQASGGSNEVAGFHTSFADLSLGLGGTKSSIDASKRIDLTVQFCISSANALGESQVTLGGKANTNATDLVTLGIGFKVENLALKLHNYYHGVYNDSSYIVGLTAGVPYTIHIISDGVGNQTCDLYNHSSQSYENTALLSINNAPTTDETGWAIMMYTDNGATTSAQNMDVMAIWLGHNL